MNNIANINQAKNMTTATLIIPVILYSRQLTKFLRLGLCDINLSGRKILNSLTILTKPKELPSSDISIIEKKTITKSN